MWACRCLRWDAPKATCERETCVQGVSWRALPAAAAVSKRGQKMSECSTAATKAPCSAQSHPKLGPGWDRVPHLQPRTGELALGCPPGRGPCWTLDEAAPLRQGHSWGGTGWELSSVPKGHLGKRHSEQPRFKAQLCTFLVTCP